MIRPLLLVVVALAFSAACTSGGQPKTAPADTTCEAAALAAPGSTTTATGATGPNRRSPAAAVCALYDALRSGDCEAIKASLTPAVVSTLTDRAGGEPQLCSGLGAAADEIVKQTSGVLVSQSAPEGDKADRANVALQVTDRTGRTITSVVPVTKQGDEWRVNRLDV